VSARVIEEVEEVEEVMTIVLGTRGSRLALAQTELAKQAIERLPEKPKVVVEIIKTTGDQRLDIRLRQPGPKIDQGLFTKELEEALLRREIDLAVHSLKDLPTALPTGLELAATLPRHDPGDVLISKSAKSLGEVPWNAIVATGSLRRARQILLVRPDLRIVDIRGNVPTRIAKLVQESSWNAIVLAKAGLERLGYILDEGRIEALRLFVSNLVELLPAVGQGAIGLQVRSDDTQLKELLVHVNDAETWFCIQAERELLSMLGGGCHLPLGVRTRIDGAEFSMEAILFRDQISPVRVFVSGVFTEPREVATALLHRIYGQGK
jgi:hydroxymethylbilane synthase